MKRVCGIFMAAAICSVGHCAQSKRKTLSKSGIDVDRIRSCLERNVALYGHLQ